LQGEDEEEGSDNTGGDHHQEYLNQVQGQVLLDVPREVLDDRGLGSYLDVLDRIRQGIDFLAVTANGDSVDVVFEVRLDISNVIGANHHRGGKSVLVAIGDTHNGELGTSGDEGQCVSNLDAL